jgi:nucleoside-diphosphate-sugar epimerase
MKVAVTGGTGCMGFGLSESLFNRRFDVRALVLPRDTESEVCKDRAQVVEGDLNSFEALENLTRGVEVVFHLAGKVHSVPKTEAEKQEFLSQNVDGTKLLLEAARINRVKRLIFYSSVAVYGKDADFHGDEASACFPESAYARSKHIAEQLVLNAHENGGPEGVVLRFPVAYGPKDRGNVASLIRAISHRRFLYFGDGVVVRSMISSRNAAEAALIAAIHPDAAGQIFCVTDCRDYSMKELVTSICRALEMEWRPLSVPLTVAGTLGRIGDVIRNLSSFSVPINSDVVRKLSRPLTFSCEKARTVLGYEPVETLEHGIAKEVEWLRETQGVRP